MKRKSDHVDTSTDADADAETSSSETSAPGTSDSKKSSSDTSSSEKLSTEKPGTEKPKSTKSSSDKPKRARSSKEKGIGLWLSLRTKLATLIWLIAVVCALFLAIGALVVALKMNRDNAIVGFIIDGAKKLDFGTFKEFKGANHVVKSALVNWGIAAVIYLVVGKIIDRIIRP